MNEKDLSIKNSISLLASFVAALFLIATAGTGMIGCAGDTGPAGQDGASFDTTPPTISLLEPAYGELFTDTMRVTVNAVDNVGIDEVLFFLDGSDQLNDSTWTSVTEAPYTWTYNLFDMGVSDGAHTLMVRAYDTERNHADTPTILVNVNRLAPLGNTTLVTAPIDTLVLRSFPKRNINTGVTTDTLLYALFSPDRSCRIDSFSVWLDSIPGVNMVYDTPLQIGLHYSNGIYPEDTLLTVTMQAPAIDSYGWQYVSLDDNGILFDRGDRFHVSVSAKFVSDTTKMAIGTTLVPTYDFAAENLSGYYAKALVPARWQTFQESLDDPTGVPELLIRVHVYYYE